MEPRCRLDCKSLSTKDYTDLLWTTVAEFPGICNVVAILLIMSIDTEHMASTVL